MIGEAAGTRELYIYWKTAVPADAVLAVRCAQGLLTQALPGLQARALLREEAGSSPATLMEIYTHPDGIDAALKATIESAIDDATASLRVGPRHTEVFLGIR